MIIEVTKRVGDSEIVKRYEDDGSHTIGLIMDIIDKLSTSGDERSSGLTKEQTRINT